MDLRAKAELLRSLHVPGEPLVLLNVWDAAGAAVVAGAGAPAVATASAAIAAGLGVPDGQVVTRAQMLEAVARIAAAVDVPVSADMEAGYGDTPEAATESALGVIDAGAAGLNLEDTAETGNDPLLSVETFAAKVAAVRSRADDEGVPLVINARTDVYLAQVGEPDTRLEHAIGRGRAYLEAGADCVFVPGAPDARTIRGLVDGIGGPVSVINSLGAFTVAELAALGVTRVSVGPGAYRSALGLVRLMASEAYDAGTFDTLAADQVLDW